MASLDVLMEGQLAAHLALPESGWPVLRYRDSYMQASLATPLSTLFVPERVEHSGEPLSNWLLGLLPDDDRVLDSLRERYGTQKSRPLDLLGTPIGADCAGAVQFCTPGQTADLLAGQGGLHHLSDDEVLDCLDEIRRDPAYRPEGYDPGGGFSLAGMQPKIALRRTPDGWALPWGAEPTSHIIKITRSGVYDHEALMEHLTMATARNLGMRVPQTAVIRRGELEAIVVTRYDRARRGGRLVRIHQEDLCQASGLHPDYKYQRDGGPSPAAAAALLRRVAGTAAADAMVRQLRDMLILQWLVVHNDAHSKNFSLMLAGGRRALAPLYDACTWLPYRRSQPIPKLRTAMKIGRDYRISSADRPKALTRTADALGLDGPATARRFEEMATGLPDALREAVESLPARDQDLPTIGNYIIEQTRRAQGCEQTASRAVRQATATRRTGATPGGLTGAQLHQQPATPRTCQHPSPTKGGRPCGKPLGPAGRCGVPGHKPGRA